VLTLVAALVVILAILVVAGLVATGRSLRIVQQYEQGIVFRFGKVLPGTKGPGLHVIRPVGDRMQKVNMQIIAMAVPAQDGITRDNVTVRVDAVVYFRVVDPIKATVNVQNYMFAVSQQAQTSLRSIIGQSEMDQLLAERAMVNKELRRVIDEPTEGPWGIRVERVEIKDVSLPEGMKRSMSRQAEAERERRARIITADGEYQASKRLAAAANVMARDPAALQLRLLQTVVEVAAERNSTLVMPIPVELLRFFDKFSPPSTEPPPGQESLADYGDAEVAAAEAEIAGRGEALEIPEVPPIPEISAEPPAATGHVDLTDTMPGEGEFATPGNGGFAPLTGRAPEPGPATFAPPAQDAPPFDAGPYEHAVGHLDVPDAAPAAEPAPAPPAGPPRPAKPAAPADPDALAETTMMAAVPDGTAEMPAVPDGTAEMPAVPPAAAGTEEIPAVAADDDPPAPRPRRRTAASGGTAASRRAAASGASAAKRPATSTRRRKPADGSDS
jgi:regulator of protease activity HflC (stomatin/prohibitin superfamily)